MPDASTLRLSDDQAEAYDQIAEVLTRAGVDLAGGTLLPVASDRQKTRRAVLGKAGSGKTMLLAEVVSALTEAGVEPVSADWESRKAGDKRTFAVLAPTNKAASVLRQRGVPATTIHRILYTPVYDPEYEKIAKWLAGEETRPEIEALTDAALDRAEAFFKTNKSMPGALAAAGLRGSDFITGWARRESPLDIGLIDESSMLDDKQFDDLSEIFSTLILFGDPAQLAPVGQSGAMVFDKFAEPETMTLSRIHRQEADNPILDLAHALGDPGLQFEDFEAMVEDAAKRDDRVVIAGRVESALMARSPVLVWRNATRIRLIHAFRGAFGAPDDALLPGEPLICDGIELPDPASEQADRSGNARPHQGCPGRLPRARTEARVCEVSCAWGRGSRGERRRDHQDRDAGHGGAVHPVRSPHGCGLCAWGGLHHSQGAGVPVAGGAGVCAGHRSGSAVWPGRSGPPALEAPDLCGGDPGRGPASLGDAI